MQNIILDGSKWKIQEDFYHAFLKAVGAPDWHGHNLNALNDSITGGGINKLDTPYHITITGFNLMASDAQSMVQSFQSLIQQIQSEGNEVSLDIQ
jgi:RNAse (barnase) inhibitor barstar